MDTRKLRHALALARVRNFTRAAQELNLTQSALSRSIQALEAECGITLFDRGRGAVTMTQAGSEFVRRAEDLLRSETAFRSFVGDVSRGAGGRIGLGVTPIAARVLLAPVLADYVDTPNFSTEITVASTRQLLRMVAQQVVDLAIGLGDMPWTDPMIAATPLITLELAVIVRAEHPLSRLDTVSEEDFDRYPLVRSASFSLDDSLPVTLGLTRNRPPAVTIEDFHVLERLVHTSDAAWITAPVAVSEAISAGTLIALPLSWVKQSSVPLAIYSLANRSISPLMQRVLDQLRMTGHCANINSTIAGHADFPRQRARAVDGGG